MAVKVLIVDDSAIVRQTLERELNKDPEIEVVGTAQDPYVARDKIFQTNPDVLTLDIEMPRMDGISFLKKLMTHHPLPVVIVSSLSREGSTVALEAVRAGAVEVLRKPGSAYSINEMSIELRNKVKAAAKVRFIQNPSINQRTTSPLNRVLSKYVIIGASTGGTQAIEALLSGYPANAPGTVIVQHMPAGFTAAFAKRLNDVCEVEVKEAEDGELVTQGKALIAPGNMHTLVERHEDRVVVRVKDGPLIGHHRPSVDVLFRSAAQHLGKNALGVILTGMGSDGTQGLLAMKQSGAFTIGQDEESSVVYGMPKAAFEAGAVQLQAPLNGITEQILLRA